MLDTALIRRPRLPGGRPFHLLITSLAVSSCGDWLYNVGLLALVYERTGSATWVSLTTAARVFPIVAFGPLGGVLADRYDRRRLMVGADLLRAGLMVLLGVVAVAGLPILLAPLLAGAATAAGVVYPSCVAACTARFVDDQELQRANAVRSAVGQAAIVVGPALGALMMVVAGPSVSILLNAVTFIASAIAVGAIRAGEKFAPPERGSEVQMPSVLADIRTGARALRGAPTAIRLVAADVLGSAVYGMLTVTLVLVSRKVGGGTGGYGLLLGGFGVGGVIGATVTARLDAPSRWRGTLALAMLLVGIPLAALGLVPTLAGAVALAVLGGGGMIVGEVLCETALPRMLDDDVLARAYGLVFPVSISGIVAGSLIAGPLVSAFGLTGTLAVGGAAVLTIGALLLSRPLDVTPVIAAPAPSAA
ncbi:MAG TPA: MFS transporter [Solirubrobacteraceae bacterium]|nr:MFS transporter [Solirubrobacteraceae bacterium]